MKAIFILLMMIPALLFGQKTAMWETKLFFEDTLGNKDSVTIGHDLAANFTYNPDFGEVNIKDQPWDSVFEVRASHDEAANGWSSPKVLSKKIIGSTEGGLDPKYNCVFVRERLKVFVKCKAMPVKISWDSTMHSGYCNQADFMTPNGLPSIFPDWFRDPEFVKDPPYVCMAEKSSYVVKDFKEKSNGFLNFILETNLDGTQDTIYGLLLTFLPKKNYYSPCQGTVGVKEQNQNEPLVNIYPNPANSAINLEASDDLSWEVYDIQGKLLKRGETKTIDIADIQNGLYILHARTDKAIVMKKFIKTE